MASIVRDPNGRKRILFVASDGKRKSIRLGKIPQKFAEEVKTKVEYLNATIIGGIPLDGETAGWLSRIGNELSDKLAAVGLIPKRASARLGDFLDAFIAERTDIKPNTRRNLEAAKARLIEFFTKEKPLREITAGEGDSWLLWLDSKYAKSTSGRTVKRAKQFFRFALRRKLISENPFDEVKAHPQTNEARKCFIDRAEAEKVLEACPDVEWRLLFALSRFGGLRCPSEHLALSWSDVDWERSRFLVHSPKTEGHEGKAERWVPIFPELRPHFEAAFDAAEPGTVWVINRYREANQNLRTQFLRILRRAGLKPWQKLFHNLRASRQTELAESFPLHVVCEWIGNSQVIAKNHYLQVPDMYFERAIKSGAESGAHAAQNAAQSATAENCLGLTETQKTLENPGFLQELAIAVNSIPILPIPPRGLEPLSSP
jgi:integrase